MWPFGRRSPQHTLPPPRRQPPRPTPRAPRPGGPELVDRQALTMKLAQERMLAAEERAHRAEKMQSEQLAELKAMRAVIGALGGTMGTVETHVGQLVAMAREHLAAATPQHRHGVDSVTKIEEGPCPVPSCSWGRTLAEGGWVP